mgnify:CR=1 FL=1
MRRWDDSLPAFSDGEESVEGECYHSSLFLCDEFEVQGQVDVDDAMEVGYCVNDGGVRGDGAMVFEDVGEVEGGCTSGKDAEEEVGVGGNEEGGMEDRMRREEEVEGAGTSGEDSDAEVANTARRVHNTINSDE